MKRLGFLSVILLWTVLNVAEAQTPQFAILPKPVSLELNKGSFELPQHVLISSNSAKQSEAAAVFLKTRIGAATGRKVSLLNHTSKKASIRFEILHKQETQLGNEGYRLLVTPRFVTIKANHAAGLFYGVQTVLQLFPKEIEAENVVQTADWTLPCVEILDFPRLPWRGLMFDVARHFFTKDEVKQYIDAMVRYKYNLLHLHLTDNEGWRIEIKKYPKLTAVGAWRPGREGNFGTFSPPAADAANDYGGFYTQDDIRELVQYAKERFVDILPEIDVPGHSLAAVVAYPELSCTPEAVNYRVRSGERIMDWSAGGKLPQAIYDNNLCPANESVYSFIDDVLEEVVPLFPFSYIHMGGDETSTNYWEKSEAVKELMAREGLKDMHQVQGYFAKRVKSLVEKRGKKFMGWDEILDNGLPQDAAVMVWHNPEKAVEASRLKHAVVLAPIGHNYLDLRQGDAIIEPPVYKEVRLSKTYQFNPVPAGSDAAYILGGQANLWTENVYNIRHAEYMTWPRGFAVAEALWSADTTKNWPEFFHRVEDHFKRLDLRQTKYAPSVYDPIFTVRKSAQSEPLVTLSTEVEGLSIHYSFDNSYPDRFYPRYEKPLSIPKDATLLRVITYRGDEVAGRMQNMPVEEITKRIKD
ncbi:MAG: beta-N-acetylhexosaminidase [Arcticibacter sp.]